MTDTVAHQIHACTLEVLRDVGLVWPHEPSLRELETRGFDIDYTRQTVRMSPNQVESALELAPRDVSLYTRDGEQRLTYDQGPLLMGAGTGVAVIDLETQQRRPATSADVSRLVRIQDALPNVDIPRPIISATDAPPRHNSLVEYALALCNTTKHVHHRILSPEDVEPLMEIGAAIVGSFERLRERPIFSGCYCPLSPLSYRPENVECMLAYAKYGIPFQILDQTIPGVTAPPTMLGSVIVTNAEIVGTITILQALSPGAQVLYGGILTPMDMRLGSVSYGAPEVGTLTALAGVMARHYGFVSVLCGLRTDAKRCDEQAGFEKALNLGPVLSVADIIYGAGNLDTGLTCGYDQLVLDNELMGAARRQLSWKPSGDGQLEVDLIKKAGPKGNFLSLKLTAQWAERAWYPEFFVRTKYETWAEKRTDPGELARERAKEIVKTHEPAPLPPQVVSEIRRIMGRVVDQEFVARAFAERG